MEYEGIESVLARYGNCLVIIHDGQVTTRASKLTISLCLVEDWSKKDHWYIRRVVNKKKPYYVVLYLTTGIDMYGPESSVYAIKNFKTEEEAKQYRDNLFDELNDINSNTHVYVDIDKKG